MPSMNTADGVIFHGVPKSIKLDSFSLGYGPMPPPDSIVEQKITITDIGQVRYRDYKLWGRHGGPELNQERHFEVSPANAQKLLDMIARYFSGDYQVVQATDIGHWTLWITNTEGETFSYSGSLCAALEVDEEDLSDLLREVTGVDDLFAFDGNNNEDPVMRITVDYHRVTKEKPEAPPADANYEYLTWDYTEKLVIDRATETLEHIQIVGSGCKISHKYEVEDGISELMNEFDADYLFDCLAEEPEDVCDDPMEKKDYQITVDFRHGERQSFSGYFDKYGLPLDYPEFAETVLEFIRFYGIGEILNPSVYEKTRRRSGDYMYCGVTFQDSSQRYHYISDDSSIEEDDLVIVPVGKENRESIARVETIEYCSAENAPFPFEKTKHIIRKAEQDEVIPTKQEWSGWCPAAERNVDVCECMEICDVADNMLSERILEDYEQPIVWSEDKSEKCRKCKYHVE